MSDTKHIAPCGLDCSLCKIYMAHSSPEIADDVVKWLKEDRGVEARREDIRCDGCMGDLSHHWSADCDLRKCCIEERKALSCSECCDLPCEKLQKWATYGQKYADAVERLKASRKNI